MRKAIKRNRRLLFILSFCILFFICKDAQAQTYKSAVGVKAGYSSGIEFKHFVDRDFAIEAQALYNSFGFQLSALYEYQFTPHPKERLQYFFGAGIHGGNWENEFAIGAALFAGSEYIFRKAPLIIGLEWKPMINIFRVTDFVIPDIGITVKVIIN